MKKLKILVVEDTPEHVQSAQADLGQPDVELKIVGTCREALEEIRMWSPTVVLTDLNIPQRPGSPGQYGSNPIPLGTIVLIAAIKAKVPFVSLLTLGHGSDGQLTDESLAEAVFYGKGNCGSGNYIQSTFCATGFVDEETKSKKWGLVLKNIRYKMRRSGK